MASEPWTTLRLAEEWHQLGSGVPIYSDPLPQVAADLMRPRPITTLDATAALRVGIVPDRFQAGHKLKAGAYIAAPV